ncbi:MAG: hypothetical protein N3D11_12025 [Candidatus Sumerlaeia bacterium]|nr:hypothetical protein [Candidatus Sumerlaeia bacterium]
MAKRFVKQLIELQKAAEALPAIREEVQKIEASLAKLQSVLGGPAVAQPGKKRGRPRKALSKPTAEKPTPKSSGLIQKILAHLESGAKTAAQLMAVDGRANPKTLNKWVSLGILKRGPGGRYRKP